MKLRVVAKEHTAFYSGVDASSRQVIGTNYRVTLLHESDPDGPSNRRQHLELTIDQTLFDLLEVGGFATLVPGVRGWKEDA